MRRFVLGTWLTALCAAGCGEKPPSEPPAALGKGTPAGSASDARPQRESCDDGEIAYGLVQSSSLSWVVVKKGNAPVVGKHKASGRVSLKEDELLSKSSMRIDFDLGGSISDHELRDERLRAYFFLVDEAPEVSFVLTAVDAGSEMAKLPDQGVTLPVTLKGNLLIAGYEIALDLPVLLTGTEKGLKVNEGTQGIALDIRKQLGLGKELDALLGLVAAEMLDDVVRIRFEMTLEDACR